MMQILADLDPELRLPVRPGWPEAADDTTIIERLAAFTAAAFARRRSRESLRSVRASASGSLRAHPADGGSPATTA